MSHHRAAPLLAGMLMVAASCRVTDDSAGSAGRVVTQPLRPGDVDGDIQLLLDMAMPYEAPANTSTTVLVIRRGDLERLPASHPALSQRWLTSVSQRLARSHARLTGLLGESLEVQVAQLLLEESDGDALELSQATLAAR